MSASLSRVLRSSAVRSRKQTDVMDHLYDLSRKNRHYVPSVAGRGTKRLARCWHEPPVEAQGMIASGGELVHRVMDAACLQCSLAGEILFVIVTDVGA